MSTLQNQACSNHRRRSGWNSGGRMASAEGGLVLGTEWVGMGGVFPPSRLGDPGDHYELRPSGVRGRVPAENGFWSILKATERSFLYLYDKIGRRQFALPSFTPNSGGGNLFTSLPRDLRPWQLLVQWCHQLWGTGVCAHSIDFQHFYFTSE